MMNVQYEFSVLNILEPFCLGKHILKGLCLFLYQKVVREQPQTVHEYRAPKLKTRHKIKIEIEALILISSTFNCKPYPSDSPLLLPDGGKEYLQESSMCPVSPV